MELSKYQKMIKVELHRHLEGAVRLDTIFELARHHNLEMAKYSLPELSDKILIKDQMRDLQEVIDKFWNIQLVLNCPENIERITFEAIEDAWFDGIRLLELRYSPSFIITNSQLTYDDVLSAINSGIKKAIEKYDMGVGMIGMVSRSFDIKVAETVFEHMFNNKQSFVGFDVCDVEVPGDVDKMSDLLSNVNQAGFNLTIHSGETPNSAENMLRSIQDFKAQRIGHGIDCINSEEALECVRDNNIVLEICPTSNFLTQGVKEISEHPARELFQKGVKICINSDDPGIMNISSSHEYRVCMEQLGFSGEEMQAMCKNALHSSFIDNDRKKYYEKKYF